MRVPKNKVEGNHTLSVLWALLSEGLNADMRKQALRSLDVPLSADAERSLEEVSTYFEGMAERMVEHKTQEMLEQLAELHELMAADGREHEFPEALRNAEKRKSLFAEYGVTK